MTKILIVIPTFNESESIPILLSKIDKVNVNKNINILIVDDESPDGTSEIVEKLKNKYSNLNLITKTFDKGFSKAYITGFKYGLEQNIYDIIVQMDADGSHQPVFLESMIKKIEEGYEYVIGSRWVKGGSVVNWPFSRKILSIGGNIYARILLRSKNKDITGGFKAINVELLKKMKTETITTTGYSFQIEMYLRAKSLKAKICEVPIEFIEREKGVSKMSKKIVLEAIKYVTVRGLKKVAIIS